MTLFEPNNLSLAHPVFERLTDRSVARELESVLAHYPLPRTPATVGVFSGTNVVSQNYLVEWTDRKIFLKSREGLREDGRLLDEVRLGRVLRERGVRVPTTLRTLAGEDLVAQGERRWVAYEFEEGDYFQGLDGELEKAGEAFARLTAASQDISPDRRNPVEQPKFLTALEGLLGPSARDRVTDTVVRQLIVERHSAAMAALEHVRSHADVVEGLTMLVHTDFHPLNLLARPDGTLCILDLEDVKPYPLLAALGFGSYKLIRQMWTHAHIREMHPHPGGLVERWLTGWNRIMSSRYTIPQLGLGARYRVLALLYFILDHWSNGRNEYTDDLEKQFASLSEIDVIYGPLSTPGARAAVLESSR